MTNERYRNYKVVGVARETDPKTLQLLDEAERELESHEMRVNIRWGRDQVHVVKRAAALLDVPYQVYIKHLVMRQAIADVEAAEHALASRSASRKG